MEVEVLDLTICCRLCLVPITEDAMDLYTEQLMEHLEAVFHTSFAQAEWLPRTICRDCQGSVSDLYDFVHRVLANQEYLQSLNLWSTDVKCPTDERIAVEEADSDDKMKDEFIVEEDKPLKTDEEEDDDQQIESPANNLRTEEIKECASEDDDKQIESPTENLRTEETEECASEDEKREDIPKKSRKLRKNKSLQKNRSKEEELIKRYYMLRCDLCSQESSNFKSLLDHFREAHKVSGYIKCCNKKLYRRCRLLEHISKHQDPETFRCEICNKSYACRTSLELHKMHLHLSENEKPFKCSACPRSFAKDYQLKCHKVRHVAVECPQCGRIMSSRLSLREHLINMHSDVGQRLLVCDICGKEFRSKNSFERHVLVHQGVIQENRIQCHLCSRWLANKMGLQKHIRTQHTEAGEKFVCGDCGKIAPNSAALQQHRRVVHAELKFACEVCDKRFKRAISLKEHRAIHTGESLYSCRFCPMTFISNANMYSHQKKLHPEEWQKTRESKVKK